METVPGQGIPPMTTQPVPANPTPYYPPGLPQMMPQGPPIQIALPGELQTIMQQWPAVKQDLETLKARPTGGGPSPWQGFALFLLGGSLMAAAVFVWPYASRLF